MSSSMPRQLGFALRSASRSAVAGSSKPTLASICPRAFAPASRAMKFSTARTVLNSASQKKEEETKASGEAMGATDKNAGDDALQAQIKEKDAKIKELQEAILYGKADYQNLQRRSKDEKAQAGDFAITKLAKDLTSSIDILGLALKSVPEELRTTPKELDIKDPRRVIADLYSGVELTSKSLLDMLRTHGIVQFDPTGEKFDPKEHEALYQAPVPGKEPGTVLECSKVGYKIKDRLLRAAEVGVVQSTN
ncbi:related to MGE1 - heat shock protein - chaperone [Melanopsichium pennsylvanicum]|uniref:GrpE protein homolog n=2 Tax=Melanopsichium pennsylvanicum TaxID=63383 RepID=A0AAJ4XP98_9BASI|nr:related to MGE1-heat shock protein-chaperone [Melanopsichium pennsylvanicum 4]SNX85990.1 related to MGE1 - heat shock protein - chaperone [Melanopsichium pennsylvanicum]